MMPHDTNSWVLTSVAAMPPDRRQLWRAHCFVESDVDVLLADPVRSIVISTYGGCGISTSLALLRDTRLLVLPYNPEQWPGQPQAFTRAETHFAQWMAHFVDAVTERLDAHPDQLVRLNPYQHQFVIWLLGRYLGRRQSIVWQGDLQQRLPGAMWEQLGAITASEPIEYSDTVADLKYQIHECVAIARCLGWDGVFAGIEISWWDWLRRKPEGREQFEAQVRALLTTLTPLEVPHFGVKVGLDARVLPPPEIDKLTRSRIKPMIYPMTYRWTIEQLQQTCRALVVMAGSDLGLTIPPPPLELWAWLDPDITSIWERPCPAAARALAQIWLDLANAQLPDEQLRHELRTQLYRRAAPLRRDPRPGSQVIYRGELAIHLDEMPLRVFNILWQHRGAPAGNEALLREAGTKANLDKLISRLREQIEPLYRSGTIIYLQRRPGSGAWLDPSVSRFSL